MSQLRVADETFLYIQSCLTRSQSTRETATSGHASPQTCARTREKRRRIAEEERKKRRERIRLTNASRKLRHRYAFPPTLSSFASLFPRRSRQDFLRGLTGRVSPAVRRSEEETGRCISRHRESTSALTGGRPLSAVLVQITGFCFIAGPKLALDSRGGAS